MTDAARVFAIGLVAVAGIAGVLGVRAWYRVEPSRAFWPILRASQGLAIVQAAVAGLLALSGSSPRDDLYWLYALLPLAVSFVAEQLRAVSAEQVLENRGLEDARAVGRLPEAEQRAIVLAIVRRETGIMALSAFVVCFLALRALGTL